MGKDKYDIPYAMKPKGKGKGKQSKYSTYIEDKNKGYVSSLSPDAKKLIAYITFFVIFSYVFLTALRSSKVPESVDYELDLDYSNSRERNLIDDSFVDADAKFNVQDFDEDNVEDAEDEDKDTVDTINGIDVLDSDSGELSGEIERKNVKKKEAASKGKKAGKTDFDVELDELIEKGNDKINIKDKKSKGTKKTNDEDEVDVLNKFEKFDKIKRLEKEKIKREPIKNGVKY